MAFGSVNLLLFVDVLSIVGQDENHCCGRLTNDAQARVDFLLAQVFNNGIGEDPSHDSRELILPHLPLDASCNLIMRLKYLWMQKPRLSFRIHMSIHHGY